MKCLVVAVVLALGTTANTGKFSKEDLKKALESTNKLWTVERNFERHEEGGPVSCVYDEIRSLDDDKYQFTHHYKVAETWVQVPLYGSLEEENENVVLYIKINEEDKGNQHVLRALDKEKNCFILTYRNATSNVEQCSLHVPEEIVFSEGSAGAQCTKLYDQTCTEDEEGDRHVIRSMDSENKCFIFAYNYTTRGVITFGQTYSAHEIHGPGTEYIWTNALDIIEKLWAVVRRFNRDGEGGSVECVYDKNVSFSGDNYLFTHLYQVAHLWHDREKAEIV